MISFQYTARNSKTGELVKSVVEANNEKGVATILQAQGLSPLVIKKISSGSSTFKFFNKVRAKDRVLFARQLATLINAGLPLVQALRSVSDQTTSKPLKAILSKIISNVESGQTFSSSLSNFPNVFNQIFVNLVAAGETSGTLDQALERIAIQQEKDADISSKIRGAMTYPIIVLVVMIAIVIFMLVKVLPQVQLLYASFPGASLPIETRLLLGLSSIMTKFWWIVILLLIGLIIFINFFRKTRSGRIFFDTLKIKLPPINVLFVKLYMARFARTAATLVSAGVPLLQVLEISSKNVVNVLVSQAINKAGEKVKGGTSLGEALTGDPYFLPLVPNMIKIGEQSGAMESMLDKAASYYENEVDQAIKNISSIIEPIMMVLLGIMALVIVAAVLLPIYSLAGSGAISSAGG